MITEASSRAHELRTMLKETRATDAVRYPQLSHGAELTTTARRTLRYAEGYVEWADARIKALEEVLALCGHTLRDCRVVLDHTAGGGTAEASDETRWASGKLRDLWPTWDEEYKRDEQDMLFVAGAISSCTEENRSTDEGE